MRHWWPTVGRTPFKQDVAKQWMTLWGKVVVSRQLYQPDRGGAPGGCRWMSPSV